MPDLSLEASHRFWFEYRDKAIYRVVAFLEGVEEGWTKDGDAAFEVELSRLGTELDDISTIDLATLGHEEALVRIVANLKTSRGLRLLQALDAVHPGAASRLLVYAEENTQSPNDPAGIFLRRNIVFERLRLLSRVLAPERLSLVLRVLEGEDHE